MYFNRLNGLTHKYIYKQLKSQEILCEKDNILSFCFWYCTDNNGQYDFNDSLYKLNSHNWSVVNPRETLQLKDGSARVKVI